MFTSKTERTITQLVDKLLTNDKRFTVDRLPDGSCDSAGILIEVELEVTDPSIEDYDEKMDGAARRFYYIVFCRNVSVFVARRRVEDGLQHYNEMTPSDWYNMSNHDSCWRGDGMRWLSKAYFDMCDEVNSEVAPIKLEADATIGFMNLWKDVTVNTTFNDERCRLNSVR